MFDAAGKSNLKQFCIERVVPSKLRCRRRGTKQLDKQLKKEKAWRQARELLQSEIELISLIQFMRYVRLALEKLLTPTVRNKLRTQSIYVDLDDDACEVVHSEMMQAFEN